MDRSYEPYCISDPLFYESPTRHRRRALDFAVAQRPVPPDWRRTELGDCLAYLPCGGRLPPQGWKIHASASLDNAQDVLAAVWDYCVPRQIAFKFIRSERLLLLRNAKSADRSASGKFVTIYPVDETQFEVILTELGTLLTGQQGPYILSDLRWGQGPLYVRYGGFELRTRLTAGGELQPAVEDSAGQLVADRRGPTFEVPSWVTLPDCLRPHLAARNSAAISDLPYDIERALHFSNGGGVYLGRDRRTGEQVVIKEARPHAGLSFGGADAVARLERERKTLESLAGLPAVPAVRNHFTLGEHHFLVQDFVEGPTLNATFIAKYPLISLECDEAAIAAYRSWAIEMCGKVELAVGSVHERGIVIHDLHPSNILLRPDGQIVLIDWEVAAQASDRSQATLGAVGFTAPSGTTGIDVDRYALACLRLYLFLPLTTLLGIDRGKAAQLGAEIIDVFPVPRDFVAEAVEVIRGVGSPAADASSDSVSQRPKFDLQPDAWPDSRDAMVRAILASATPERDDRLFPGDIQQFAPGGGINVAFGAAGVLYALHRAGSGQYAEFEGWLIRHAMQRAADTPLGFYDGLHGVAYVLDGLDRRREAMNTLDVCIDRLDLKSSAQRLDLFGGLAGIGLSLAHFAEAASDNSLWRLAQDIATVIADQLGDEDSVALTSGGEHSRAGLMRGSSGPALLLLRLYERTHDAGLLDLAETALRQDLRRCVVTGDGTLQVNEGWRTMPYLADGSVGIGMVLDEYLAHRPDEQLMQSSAAIRRAAESRFYMQPGLFEGLAGMIVYLSRPPGREAPDGQPAAWAQVRRLARYAMRYAGGIAFPGNQLLRLSMDLATGTAGVILSAACVGQHGPAAHLPFFPGRATKLHAHGSLAATFTGR